MGHSDMRSWYFRNSLPNVGLRLVHHTVERMDDAHLVDIGLQVRKVEIRLDRYDHLL